MALQEAMASREELEAYIGDKAKDTFYKNLLDKYFLNPNKPSWSFVACIFNTFWLAYRKALMPSLIVFVAFFSIITVIPFPLSYIFAAIIYILMGLFGMNIYLLTAEKEISRIKSYNPTLKGKKLLELIAEKGKPSHKYSFVLVWVSIIFLSIFILR
ncbi:MAG: DUF2628 domain-containing protein [Clostridiales bacterium]|nr:DUF2628 domain-containing protein [Clostridiales bacterium]